LSLLLGQAKIRLMKYLNLEHSTHSTKLFFSSKAWQKFLCLMKYWCKLHSLLNIKRMKYFFRVTSDCEADITRSIFEIQK